MSAARSSRAELALALIFVAACSKAQSGAIRKGAELRARDDDGVELTLRVDDVEVDAKDAEISWYTLSRKSSDGAWVPYCTPDRDGKNLAVPLAGWWDATRTHHDDKGVITFACTNGALGKCVRFGYAPWKTRDGVSLAPYHQACVHMVGADYCGNGQPHTRNGTPIDIFDRLGIQTREPSEEMLFEAAWSPDGAVYVAKPRFQGESVAALASACPDRLRASVEEPGLDDHTVGARFPEALLFTESRANPESP